MLERADEIPRGTTLRAAVCIVGGGAAGITIARALADTDHEVVLLESGTFEFTEATQNLYRGTMSGIPNNLVGGRLRFFGGTTNHWAGQSRPMNPVDFEKRSWVANSGWPFGREELDPYYPRASKMCDLGPFEYEPEFWERRIPDLETVVDNQTVRPAIYQIGPGTHFGEKFRKVLEDSENVRVVLGANVGNVRVDGRRVAGVDVKTLDGNEFAVDADVVVLALGGIDNPRLLLASRSQRTAGLGNEHDLVGRYFMDHTLLATGRLVISESAPNPELFFFVGVPMERAGIKDAPGALPRFLFGQFALTPRASRDAEIPAFAALLAGRFPGDETAPIISADIASLVGDVEGRTGVQRPELEMIEINGRRRVSTNYFEVAVNMEPTPYAESRVTLTAELDRLGMPRIDLAWRFDPNDYASLTRGAAVLAREFGRVGLGRMHVQPPEPLAVKYGNHHMGTTRMHQNPTRGVVDQHGEVHDVANLYMAGSSVFPAVGFSNPTLTIVALALRMAERLQKVLDR